MSAHALATRPNPLVRPTPGPRTSEQPPVVRTEDLIFDASLALSAALASAQSALRKSRELLVPAPFEITARLSGVHAAAPMYDVMEIAKHLLQPYRIAAADYQRGLIRIEGQFDDQPWTLTSMQHRHITGGPR